MSGVKGGVVLVAAALWAAVSGSPSASLTPGPSSRTTTPVLSARRVPGMLLAAAQRPALTSELQAVVAASPENTCLTVGVFGQSLFAHRERQPVAPASNQKIITAQLAMAALGESYRFRTEVAGNLGPQGTVDGNLYLVGGGDPVLSTKAYRDHFGANADVGTSLETLADRVVDAGVRHISGSVLGDESRYDSARTVAAWPERYLDQHQLGPLSALEVDQSFTSFPPTFDEDELDQLRAADDPPAFAASRFADLLRERGVRIDGRAGAGTNPSSTRIIARISSPKLSKIVSEMLTRSDNQIAELLVKEVGKVKGGSGTTSAGLAVFAREIARLGVPTEGIVMHDGSGLDRDNRVSCALVEALLDRDGPSSSIASGLAVWGETGTLRERPALDGVKGRIRAKTGTLNDVTALSGFADDPNGPTLTFSYVANDAWVSPQLLAVQNDLAAALVNFSGDLRLSSLEPR